MGENLVQDAIAQLKTYIQGSSLSEEDKEMWIGGMEHLDEETAQDILSYLEEFPQDIGWATETLKRKAEAIKSNDDEAWSEIVAEEKNKLDETINKEEE